MYSSYFVFISALDRGEWSASRPGRDFTPGERTAVPIVQEAGWAPEPIWTQTLEENSFVRIDEDKHPFLKRESNTRPRRQSDQGLHLRADTGSGNLKHTDMGSESRLVK
jgi:hypothetical protein